MTTAGREQPETEVEPLTELPRLLIIGFGHGGGSVARAAAALGLPATIWGRRDLAEANPALHRAAVDQRWPLQAETVDVADPSAWPALVARLRRFDWVVLAHEPAPLGSDTSRAGEHQAAAIGLYGALGAAGFGDGPGSGRPARRPGPRKVIVRLGSPAGERPAVDLGAEVTGRSAYFTVKWGLRAATEAAAAQGLPVLTVAPGEIHSPWSAHGEADPYRRALRAAPSLPVVHDLPAAAVSDVTLGRAVLAAAAVGRPGHWYPVADGTMGPGRALIVMAQELGVALPSVVGWDAVSARHLLDVVHARQPLDLGLLAAHTSGLEVELAAARAMADVAVGLSDVLWWWAGAQSREQGRRLATVVPAQLASVALQRVVDPVTADLLAILAALGPAGGNDEIGGLAPALAHTVPAWAERLDPRVGSDQRWARLMAAVRAQARASTGGPVDIDTGADG